jgi:hypothetical protein
MFPWFGMDARLKFFPALYCPRPDEKMLDKFASSA